MLHLSANGQGPAELADTIHYSNGLTLSKDGQHLLVAEMLAGRMLSFPFLADGLWVVERMGPPAGPGATDPARRRLQRSGWIKVGPDGNYYIAQNGSGRVLVVNEEKKLVRASMCPRPTSPTWPSAPPVPIRCTSRGHSSSGSHLSRGGISLDEMTPGCGQAAQIPEKGLKRPLLPLLITLRIMYIMLNNGISAKPFNRLPDHRWFVAGSLTWNAQGSRV